MSGGLVDLKLNWETLWYKTLTKCFQTSEFSNEWSGRQVGLKTLVTP